MFFISVTFCYFALFCYYSVTHFATITNKNRLKVNKYNHKGCYECKIEKEENSRQSGKLTKMQVHRLKAKIYEITSTPELVEPNDCIKELDKKVNREVLCYR